MHTSVISPIQDIHPAPSLTRRFLRTHIGKATIATYAFWAAFSAVNVDFLAPFAIPIFFLVPTGYYTKFSGFLMEPVATAALAAVCLVLIPALVLRRGYRKQPWPYLVPLLFNAVFLATLLLTAERARTVAIEAALVGRTPECMVARSFFESVRHAGQDFQFHAHALFSEKGRTYYWSYRLQRFYAGRDDLDRNFECYQPARRDPGPRT